ncbi:ABC transporter ATP-binding protein [Streptomyces purpurascens]|uniref:ABC transporter ATP-binding protein n=1 Tax=Streptomyces purpurascens TaxID=1924 RepID=UPI001678F000|nr:ABC transporter ATP-binding protein [Streptomyces purpurascens]MCE7047644.1 ABC transporter ATP-binding protein/permease [Streptomyces purpurascens]GHA00991.1 ABC transporter ATP-binding protein [Streptomyces purpurascens]
MTPRGDDDPAAAHARTLLRTATRYSGARCAALCLVSTAAIGAGLLLPAALGRALDLLLAQAPATRWVLYCAGLVLLLALLDAAQTVLTGTVDARSTAWLRRRLTGHVLGVGPRAADRFGSGDLVARLVGNAAEAGTTPAARAALLAALAGPIGGVVALGLIDWWLAAVFLAGAPVLTLLLRAVSRDTSESAARYQRAQGRIAAALAEAVEGVRTVRAAGTEDKETARVLRPLPELSRAGHRMWQVQGRAAAQAVAVAPLLHLGVVAVAGVLLTRDRLSVGDVLAASRYAVLATGVGVLVGRLAGLARARAAARRLGEVRAEPATGFGVRRLPDGPGRLELRGVTARRGGRVVLDGVDLVVPGGTTLAVVGPSGAGKSLLAALAGRLADPDEGEVLLDGVPLRDLPHADLRRAVGYAFARPALLGGTVEQAIGLGLPDPSPARVREAARTALADDFVRRLPDGYDTAVADAPRSGGESQRLGLARAFAHGGRLLILDDALSSLDTVTERHITDALLGDGPGGTRLLVAHRSATAACADAVAWLDDGRVRAVGRHEELWRLAAYRAAFGEGTEAASTDASAQGGVPA